MTNSYNQEENKRLANDPPEDLDPNMKVYLLVPPGPDKTKTLAFKGLGDGKVFTFAFTSLDKAKTFIQKNQNQGMLGWLGNKFMTKWCTLEEYFANPKNAKLVIDPNENFFIDLDIPNLN